LYTENYPKVLQTIQKGFIKRLQEYGVEIIVTASNKIEELLYPEPGKSMKEDDLLKDQDLFLSFIFDDNSDVEEAPF
jgi:hypothetical protein